MSKIDNMKKSDIDKLMGIKFQNYRIKQNMKQSDVANSINLDPKFISKIECGNSRGSIETIINLCNLYKITPDAILFDLLDDDVIETNYNIDLKYKKLNLKDKKTISYFIDYLLLNNK